MHSNNCKLRKVRQNDLKYTCLCWWTIIAVGSMWQIVLQPHGSLCWERLYRDKYRGVLNTIWNAEAQCICCLRRCISRSVACLLPYVYSSWVGWMICWHNTTFCNSRKWLIHLHSMPSIIALYGLWRHMELANNSPLRSSYLIGFSGKTYTYHHLYLRFCPTTCGWCHHLIWP
jgi:hypothetical protein